MVELKQEAKKYESKTWKELRTLLFDEPPVNLTKKDFHFLTGALLVEAKQLPPVRGNPIADSISQLKESNGSPEKINEARGSLQIIWEKIFGPPTQAS